MAAPGQGRQENQPQDLLPRVSPPRSANFECRDANLERAALSSQLFFFRDNRLRCLDNPFLLRTAWDLLLPLSQSSHLEINLEQSVKGEYFFFCALNPVGPII